MNAHTRRVLHHTRALLCVSLGLLAAVSACKAPERAPVWDTAGAPARAEQAQTQFRRFGEGRFEVLSFRADGESTQVLEDDFHARSLLYRVPFKARVRFSRELTIEEVEEIQKHIGEPGWAPERHRDAVMLRLALGSGRRWAGSEQSVEATAVFEDTEPGWRLRAFDGSR